MKRVAQVAFAFVRRPVVWLPIVVWTALTFLAHHFMPVTPTHRFDLVAANLLEDGETVRTISSRRWYAAAVNPDGDSVVSVRRMPSTHLPDDGDPVDLTPEVLKARLWNVKTRSVHVIDRVNDFDFFPKGPWQPVPTPGPGEMYQQAYFVHRDTGTKSPKVPRNYVRSSSGRLVAYQANRVNHLLDLETGRTRSYFAWPSVQHPRLEHFAPRCFSEDEHLVAGFALSALLIVDVKNGHIVKAFEDAGSQWPHDYQRTMTFSSEAEALCWEASRFVNVADLATMQKRTEIPNATFLAWQPSRRVLVARRATFVAPAFGFQVWDWEQNRKIAEWEIPDAFRLIEAVAHGSFQGPETYVAISPDGQHVLYAGFVESGKPSPFFSKIREWFGRQTAREIHLEVFLLDPVDLSLQHQLQIPAERGRKAILQFTSDNRYLVFTDGHTVEHWPVPPRSWVTSALRAGGATLVLALPIVLWRWWRGRKKQKAATALPQEGAA